MSDCCENYDRDYGCEPEYEGAAVLDTFTGDELSDIRFPQTRFVVDTLLSPGLAVLAGSPKVGKSWFVLSLCTQVARGEPFLGLNTEKSPVLYIALEDTMPRLQKRLLTLDEDMPEDLHFAVNCSPLGDSLSRELTRFAAEHIGTKLIVIDTLQRIRSSDTQMSYANDYSDLTWLKKLADSLGVCILVVHHTRKMSDSDAFNEISGTNGIAGSADTLMVLKKEKRTDRKAVLTCTGREIEDREMGLLLSRDNCRWTLTSDTLAVEEVSLPRELEQLVEYMKAVKKYEGSNVNFTGSFNKYARTCLNSQRLKMMMSRYRYELENRGVQFFSRRTNTERTILIIYADKGYS